MNWEMTPYLIYAYALGILTMCGWVAYLTRVKRKRETKFCETLHRAKLKRDIHKEIKKALAATKAFNLDKTINR